ncbi:RNA polymerase sigma factor [Paraliobacillus salinarum]|uniref:RNA polymerase sigma factor n=1 Tax=Paraliobacillus salinarum TaxID=1158996 RepID=UPI0015F3D701|nr:RNA polymerase sigma factor [Paraliobacillus salinarum]
MPMVEVNREKHLTFDACFQIYYQEMLAIATRITRDSYLAEDVVQESFIKAYSHQHNIEDKSKWKAWLKTIVKRTAIDMLRKQQKIQMIPADDWTQNSCLLEHKSCSFVEEAIEKNFEYEQITKAIEALNSNLRDVMYLKWNFDLSDKEIAKKLMISISAVKTRLYRARFKLREVLIGEIDMNVQVWFHAS